MSGNKGAVATTAKPDAAKGAEDVKTNLPAAASSTALSAEQADEFQAMGTGMENVTSKDVIIPRITILQSMSPQVNERKPEFIKDAKVGQICDVALGQVFGDKIQLLPIYYATVYLEWNKERGKGLVANHGISDLILKECKQDDKGRWFRVEADGKQGNPVVPTATYYCLNLTAGGRRSFLPMSGTAFKDHKNWMTRLQAEKAFNPKSGEYFTPPIFYRSWEASVTAKSNEKGDWFGLKFEPGETVLELDPSKNLLREAQAFFEQARSGLVSGDLTSYAQDEGEGGDSAKVVGDNKAAM